MGITSSEQRSNQRSPLRPKLMCPALGLWGLGFRVEHFMHAGCCKTYSGEAWYLGIVSLLIATPVYAFMFFSPELIHTILGASASPWMVDMLNGILH